MLSNCFQICPTGETANQCPAPSLKIFPFPSEANHLFICRRLVPLEGRLAIVTDAGRDAVDATCQKTNGIACGRRSRVVLTPRRWRQVLEKQASRGRWWQTSPVTRESTEETVKTIAQGNAGCPGEPVVTTVCFLPLHTDCGCSGRPAFPAPSLEGRKRPLLRVACALSFGQTFKHASGASRRENADGCLAWLFDM
jgi:hypothetical protein